MDMSMRLVVITPPEPIISVPEVQLRLGISNSGDMLEPLIAAACSQVEPPLGWTGRAFGRQTLEARFDCWPDSSGVRLPGQPIVSITSVKHIDTAGTEQTITGSNYQLFGDRLASAYGYDWPDVMSGISEPIRVRYTAGYVAGDPVLEPARMAVALIVKQSLSIGTEDLFLRSETVEGVGSQTRAVTDGTLTLMSRAAENLLQAYRVY
jgi:uncharacterized phiE125 gp8 family phage protein